MSDTTQTNAMAEIALALAMGFFSIMVLTMVSMGSSMVTQNIPNVEQDPVKISKSAEKNQDQQQASSTASKVDPEHMVIFYKDRYFSHKFTPLSLASLHGRDKIVLAVSPDLAMSQTMGARNKIQSLDITVVVLNKSWLKAIEEAGL